MPFGSSVQGIHAEMLCLSYKNFAVIYINRETSSPHVEGSIRSVHAAAALILSCYSLSFIVTCNLTHSNDVLSQFSTFAAVMGLVLACYAVHAQLWLHGLTDLLLFSTKRYLFSSFILIKDKQQRFSNCFTSSFRFHNPLFENVWRVKKKSFSYMWIESSLLSAASWLLLNVQYL